MCSSMKSENGESTLNSESTAFSAEHTVYEPDSSDDSDYSIPEAEYLEHLLQYYPALSSNYCEDDEHIEHIGFMEGLERLDRIEPLCDYKMPAALDKFLAPGRPIASHIVHYLDKIVAMVFYEGDSLPFSPNPRAVLSGFFGPSIILFPFFLVFTFLATTLCSINACRLGLQASSILMICVGIITTRVLCFLKAGAYVTLLIPFGVLLLLHSPGWTAALNPSAQIPGNIVWETGTLPEAPMECRRRVAPTQISLFSEATYAAQFSRVRRREEKEASCQFLEGDKQGICRKGEEQFQVFNDKHFSAIQNSHTLCSVGFKANEDLNGFGVRLGIYLQWLASLFSNHLLPTSRDTFPTTYLFFNFSLAAATFAISLAPCTFSVEIEVLYWLYWGGAICVFGSNPSSARLGIGDPWVRLEAQTVFLYATHLLMLYHGIWFDRYAYDRVFSRLPCGTYHFVIMPVLDPSASFSRLRDVLITTTDLFIFYIILMPPYTASLLTPEILQSIRTSRIYKFAFSKAPNNASGQALTGTPSPLLPHDIEQNWRETRFLTKILLLPLLVHQMMRSLSGLPREVQCGIRLITPLEIKVRRYYRLRCATLGVISFIFSIIAVEVTLKWNKVVNIYSVASTGQYLALTLGLASLTHVLWQLCQSQAERRQDWQAQQQESPVLGFSGPLTFSMNSLQDATVQAELSSCMQSDIHRDVGIVFFESLDAVSGMAQHEYNREDEVTMPGAQGTV